MRRPSRRPRAPSLLSRWLLFAAALASAPPSCVADIDVVVNLKNADSVSDEPPAALLRNFRYMSQMDNSDVFVALCTPGTFSPDNQGVCHDCTVCRPGEQFERLSCIPVRDRTCANCTLCSDREIELCQCSVKTTQCVTGDRVCVKLVPTSVTLTIDLTAAVILTSRQQTLLKSGMATGYADWLGEQFSLDPATIELVNFVRVDQLNYKATFTFYEVYGDATVARIKSSSSAFFQGGLVYTFGSSGGRRRLLGAQDQAGRRLLQAQTYFFDLKTGNSTFSCNASETACTEPFTQFQLTPNGTGCSGTCNPMCPPGYGAASGGVKCELCAEGYFKSTSGNALCTECPAGATSPIGSNSSDLCRALETSPDLTLETSPTSTSPEASSSGTPPPQATSTLSASGESSGTSQTTSTPAPSPTQAPASSSQAPASTPPQTTTLAAGTSSPASGASSPATTGSYSSSLSSSAASPPSTSSSSSPPQVWSPGLAPSSSTSPQTTQPTQQPSPSSSPSSGGGSSTGTGGGSSGSSSASASNSNTDRNEIVSTINPTVNSKSDSSARSDSHAENNANNAITINVPPAPAASGASQPIFNNRNVVNVVLPPPPSRMPRKTYEDYDSDYHGPSADAVLFGTFSSGFVLFFLLFMILFCFGAAWCAMLPPESPSPPQHNHVIRYRLIRRTPNDTEEGEC